jgi:hypothetical protein
LLDIAIQFPDAEIHFIVQEYNSLLPVDVRPDADHFDSAIRVFIDGQQTFEERLVGEQDELSKRRDLLTDRYRRLKASLSARRRERRETIVYAPVVPGTSSNPLATKKDGRYATRQLTLNKAAPTTSQDAAPKPKKKRKNQKNVRTPLYYPFSFCYTAPYSIG